MVAFFQEYEGVFRNLSRVLHVFILFSYVNIYNKGIKILLEPPFGLAGQSYFLTKVVVLVLSENPKS